MPRDGFVSVGSEVFYTSDIDASYAINIKYSPENDVDDRGKSIAGNSLSLLFSPFSIDDEDSFIEANISEFDDELITSGTIDLLNFYLSKYQQTNSYIVSDANLTEDLDDIEAGSIYYVPNGEQDPNTIRGIALSAPIFAAGYGMNSSGEYLAEKEVGPIDLVWNDKIKMWATRQRFPMPGKIIEGNSNPYKAIILGTKEDEDENIITIEGIIPGEEGLVFDNIYNIGEPSESESEEIIDIPNGNTLSSGDLVTIFYDNKNNNFMCLKGGGDTTVKIYNNQDEDIPANSFVEIESYETDDLSYYVKKPSAANLPPAKLISTINETKSEEYGIGKLAFGGGIRIFTEESPSPLVGYQVTCASGDYCIQTGGFGFYVVGVDYNKITEKSLLILNPHFDVSYPKYVVCSSGAEDDDYLIVKLCNKNGIGYGEDFTVYRGGGTYD